MARETKAERAAREAGADDAAAGAITGAAAVRDEGGDADDVVAATIGGAAAGASDKPSGVVEEGDEVTGDGTGEALPPVEETDEQRVDNQTRFDRELERLATMVEDAEFESGTIVGDVRDLILDLFKTPRAAWSTLSNMQQRDLIGHIDKITKAILKKIVVVLAEQEDLSIAATLAGYSAKGEEFKINLKAQAGEAEALQLFRLDGHDVVIISADARRFGGQRKEPETQPDQPDLGFADPPKEKAPREITSPPTDDSDLAGEIGEKVGSAIERAREHLGGGEPDGDAGEEEAEQGDDDVDRTDGDDVDNEFPDDD